MKRENLLGGVVVALLLVACEAPPPSAPGPRPVIAYVVGGALGDAVRESTGDSGATYSGEVRPRIEVALAFRVGGKLASRAVEVGDRVRAGQPLARLDPGDVALAAQGAAAAVASAEAEVALANAEARRTRDLKEKNFVSQTLLDAKETALAAAEGRLRAVRAQATLAAHQQAYAVLPADADGVVAAVLAEPGQVVAAGQPVLRIARLGEKEVAISVPENRVAELQKASDLRVRLWAADGRAYRGRLREVAPQADPVTRTYAARVSVVDADEAMRLGMTATVVADDGAAAPLMVPPGAVLQQGGSPQVWLIGADNRLSARAVEVAAYREDAVLLRSGLTAGERIVAAGVHMVHAGEQVSVLPSPGRR